MDFLLRYFPSMTPVQKDQFAALFSLYAYWNGQINVISRKDMTHFYEHHVLHSLAIAKVLSFKPQTKVLDIGTGGGFPGIPLAILFPDTQFHLIDSIAKKIKVVEAVVNVIQLKNVLVEQIRAEDLKQKYHFIVSRAVTRLQSFVSWIKNKFLNDAFNQLPNGLLYLKGGSLEEEITEAGVQAEIIPISRFFKEDYFKTKSVLYISKVKSAQIV